ncbi:phosphatidylethanolamine N-methyltransferase [Malassezia pachydermatis]
MDEGLRQRIKSSSKAEVTDSMHSGGSTPTKPKASPMLGRTPDGRLFHVMETPDMVTSIFRPDTPKTPLDFVTIVSLLFQLLLYARLSRESAQVFFVVYFAFWRIAYNGGLGYVLTLQSTSRWLVRLFERKGWMDAAKCPRIHSWIEKQLKVKLGASYDMSSMPIDFSVWIFFRSLVDVILLNDFTAYSLFGLSHMHGPGPDGWGMLAVRWVIGLLFILFNVWVKMDAHRVVKDYAWYWGDCFFMCLQNLVFDGVYEVAPDPMYSIGYAGYYGLSLLTGSYTVLFVSIAAHTSQLLFLVFFENPHMERLYGERRPIAARMTAKDEALASSQRESTTSSRSASTSSASSAGHSTVGDTTSSGLESSTAPTSMPSSATSTMASSTSTSNTHDLHYRLFRYDVVLFSHLDLFRASDFLLVVSVIYALVPLVLSSVRGSAALVLLGVHALLWRLFYSFGLGWALRKQSRSKWIVRHFLKHYHYDDPQSAVLEAFDQWKVIYNVSLIMTYLSFATLAWHSYVPWTSGSIRLRYVLGIGLLALHAWSARSSFRVLGPYGWLYGDFFIDNYQKQLSYTGIYRFLNNPERIMGGAAFFGMALLSGSPMVAVAAIVSHLCHWWFLRYVESPHMHRVYGSAVRQASGVSKQLQRLVPADWRKAARPSVQELQSALTKAQTMVDQLVQRSLPQVERLVDDTRTMLQLQADRLLHVRTGDDMRMIDASKYSIVPVASALTQQARFHVGEPIPVHWTAAHNHSRRDWIGLYSLNTLASHPDGRHDALLVTCVSSRGKWVGVAEDEWEGNTHSGMTQGPLGTHGVSQLHDNAQLMSGVSVFRGSKLPWSPGTYELRYHHDGTHDVLARSEPFTIYVDSPQDPTSFTETYTILTRLVHFALAGQPAINDAKYQSADKDDLTLWTKDEVQHIADGIRSAFHVDFANEVILANANVASLSRDIIAARQLLPL